MSGNWRVFRSFRYLVSPIRSISFWQIHAWCVSFHSSVQLMCGRKARPKWLVGYDIVDFCVITNSFQQYFREHLAYWTKQADRAIGRQSVGHLYGLGIAITLAIFYSVGKQLNLMHELKSSLHYSALWKLFQNPICNSISTRSFPYFEWFNNTMDLFRLYLFDRTVVLWFPIPSMWDLWFGISAVGECRHSIDSFEGKNLLLFFIMN